MDSGLIYFKDGKLIAQNGDVRVYKMNKELFLEKGAGHSLWALENELGEYIVQLGSWPKGDCLEIGLGLGVSSEYLLTFPKVKSLTTIELDKDVVIVQKQVNPIKDDRHLVLNANGLYYAYQTKKMFDFIFLDFYSHIDEDTLPQIADMVEACRRVLRRKGKIIGWLDRYTPEKYAKAFMSIFE